MVLKGEKSVCIKLSLSLEKEKSSCGEVTEINAGFLFQGNPYGLKDATGMGMTADMGAAWGTTALQPAAPGYPYYDPTLAAYGYVN